MSKYEPCYHKGEKGFMDSDLVLNDIREWLKKTTDSQTLIDTADICLLFGKIENQEKEIERLNNIIEKLEERCKFFNEMSNEKQNRIDRCMTFNNYILHENWYGGNEKKYAQRNINILLGKETELKEIPRVGSDKE